MTRNSILFLGISWRNEKPMFSFRADRNVDEKEQINLFELKNLTIHLTKERYCIGSGGLCPYMRLIPAANKRGNKCFMCGQTDFVQYMPLKGLNDAQHDMLREQPHFNYINLFGPELIKVGVASEKNKRKRVLEQGATATMYFGQTDGLTARQIEDMVSIMLKIKQHVAWNAKMKTLLTAANTTGLEDKLTKTFHEIQEIAPDRFREDLLVTPEIIINHDKYQLQIPQGTANIRLLDALMPEDKISGKIVGIYGLVILLENESGIFAINTRNIEGFILDLSDQTEPSSLTTSGKTIPLDQPENRVELF